MDGDGTALGTGRRKVPGPHAVICVSGLGGGAQEWTGVGAALAEGGALTTAQLPRRADGPGKGRSDPLNAGRLLVQREVHRADPTRLS